MNEQQKKQLIVAAILGVVLVGVLVYQFSGGKPAAKTSGAGATTLASGAVADTQKPESVMKKAEVNIDELLTGIKEVDFDYEREKMPRDPLAALVGTVTKKKEGETSDETSAQSPTVLQIMNKVVAGILWDKVRPLAVVDNEVVYPGYEYPDGTRVEKIEKNAVTFKVGDSEIQVELKEL